MSLCKVMPNNNSDNKLSSSIITNPNNSNILSSIITNPDSNLNNPTKIIEKFNNTTYFTFANILIVALIIIGLFYNHKIIPLIRNKILIVMCILLSYIILLNVIIFIK